MKNRILILIVAVIMILGMLPGFVFAANTDFAGGSGTQVDPYLISDKYQLDNVRNYLDKCFRLTNDIEFEDGEQFLPIGDTENAFEGTFDGDGHVIKNIQINISADSNVYVGLFGYNDGEIKNLGMVGGNITATSTESSPTIETNVYAGAIAGLNTDTATIANCYNTGDIYGANAGGIAGSNEGEIQSCYNSGNISGSYVAGITSSNHGIISDCYNSATVDCIDHYYGSAAGITAFNYVKIENCYNSGGVLGTEDGIVSFNEGTISQCYYLDRNTEGISYSSENSIVYKVEPCTAKQLEQRSTFEGFDFDTVWTFDKTLHSYPAPVLKNVKHIEDVLAENNTEFAGGYGNCFSPFIISNKTHLNNVRNYLDCYFKLTCDIKFTDADFKENGAFYNEGQGFIPIGTNETVFQGVFDGNGFVISNLYMNISDEDNNAALFYRNLGVIKNLGVTDGTVSAYRSAAGIVSSNNGLIFNCYNTNTVSSEYAYGSVGGIAISNSLGKIMNCYNAGKITSRWYAGGITADSIYSTLSNCYNTGNVSGAFAGGIVGSGQEDILNCYNTGTIFADRSAGGIVGQCYGGGAPLSECYNSGDIMGYNNIGGIAGDGNGGILNCYNTGKISGTSDIANSAGGITGNGSFDIKNCYNTGKVLNSYAAGGISGFNTEGCEISNCYYIDTNEYGDYNGYGQAIKCTEKQLRLESTFENYDFQNIWYFDLSIQPYPILRSLSYKKNFTDVPVNAWYKTFVDYAVENGIFAGKGEGRFEPDANITRAEFVQVLANITGVDLAPYRANENFGDVKTTDWYSGAVNWAFENGIVSGTGYGSFSPNAKITREQMCVMLVNYVENYCESNLDETVTVSIFADDNKISGWAKNAVYKCAKAGLVSGVGNGKFDPNSSASRAQGATIFTNFHKSYIK